MPRAKTVSKQASQMHVLRWVGELADPETGLQPEGASQYQIAEYTRYTQGYVSVRLKELIKLGLVKRLKDVHEEGQYKHARYIPTDKGIRMIQANYVMLEKIDRKIEMAWLHDARK